MAACPDLKLVPPEKPFSSTYGDEQNDLTQFGIKCFSGIVPEPIFKDLDNVRHICPKCKLLLKEAVQPACGHRICRPCVEEILAKENIPCCPECGENFDKEDGAYYFPDRFARQEIKSLITICPFSKMGCNWEGKFEEYQQHVVVCRFALLACEHCGLKVRGDQIKKHTASCPYVPITCPLAIIGCSENSPMKRSDLQIHLRLGEERHLTLLVNKITSLEKLSKRRPSSVTTKYNAEQSVERSREQYDFVERDGPNPRHSMTAAGQKIDSGFVEEQDGNYSDHTRVQGMMQKLMQEEMKQIQRTLMAKLRSKDDEIAGLKATVTKLEKTVRSKNAELEDCDFRLSLIENSNHDGTMIWKIPQFSQRKADAQNGKYTSIFSLPFYTGRYGYKMCLRLYIMGDGIGKGTHLSLFFVVMRGEFDNILQWPFTHKVTFKLINQAGGRDIVDTFQPDPMSSSFRKPKSDMNIASGCPRFVSHAELECGGFVADDTIFIKYFVDTSTIHHP